MQAKTELIQCQGQWLKYKKFGVGTSIPEHVAPPIQGVGMLMCQKFEVWEWRSRPFPLTLKTGQIRV